MTNFHITGGDCPNLTVGADGRISIELTEACP